MDLTKLGNDIIELNLLLTNQTEGFDFETKHKKNIANTKFKLLCLLKIYKTLTPTMLVEKLLIAKSNLSNLCKSMIKDELIIQVALSDDKRTISYELTEKGNEEYQITMEKITNNLQSSVNNDNLIRINTLVNELKLLLQ